MLKQYINNFLFITFLYILYASNYVIIKENNTWLYLGNFFDYKFSFINLLLAYIVTIPFISYIIMNNYKSIFSTLLTLLLLVGILNGIVVYSLSTKDSIYVFLLLYVYIIFIFSVINKRKIKFRSEFKEKPYLNIKLFLFFAYLGFIFFIYLVVKYFSILNLNTISDVYIQRTLFSNIVNTWEIYFITFSKYISAFSALVVAIYRKNKYYLLITIFIYLFDYLLAAHKTSILLMLFSISYYFFHSFIYNIKDLLVKLIFCIVILFTFLINFYANSTYFDIIIGLYDRIFFVTSSLFIRFYEYANAYYLFYGGSGILGKLFSSISINEPYTFVIGEYYFSKGVQANADIISDGYINFGFIGSFAQIFILWLFFNKHDNLKFYYYKKFLLPFTFLYSIVLFSMGLQTALLTGGFIFYIIIVKYGFYLKGKK